MFAKQVLRTDQVEPGRKMILNLRLLGRTINLKSQEIKVLRERSDYQQMLPAIWLLAAIPLL